jgi:hypothetical protein
MIDDIEIICRVPLDAGDGGGTRIGLYKFLEAVRRCPSGGKAAWEKAIEQNDRRASPLPLPDLSVGKVLGNRQNTKLFSPSDIGSVLRVALNNEAQQELYSSSAKLQDLCDLVIRAKGNAECIRSAERVFQSEQALRVEQLSMVCPIAIDSPVERIGNSIYAGIITYLTMILKLDGSHIWTDWLEADFREWSAKQAHRHSRNSGSDGAHGGALDHASTSPPLLIYHKSDGRNMPTPMTTYEGLCYITMRCVGRSKVSDELADQALKSLARYKVGDARMHQELIENAQTAAPAEREFVLGVSEAIAQNQQQLEYPIDVITAAVATGESPTFVMNALTPDERCQLVLAKKQIIIDKIETAKKNANAELIAAGANQKEAEAKQREAQSKHLAIERRASIEKEADERRAELGKEADERRAKLEKEAEERRATIHSNEDRAIARDQSRIRAQTTRETLVKSKAEELASIDRCRAFCPNFDVISRKRRAPPDDGEIRSLPPVTTVAGSGNRCTSSSTIPLRGRARKELVLSSIPMELCGDPDIAAYRAVGIPDDALPKDATEAQRWRTLAATEKQKTAEAIMRWTQSCGRPRPSLVHPSCQSVTGQPCPKWLWQPSTRRYQHTSDDNDDVGEEVLEMV